MTDHLRSTRSFFVGPRLPGDAAPSSEKSHRRAEAARMHRGIRAPRARRKCLSCDEKFEAAAVYRLCPNCRQTAGGRAWQGE